MTIAAIAILGIWVLALLDMASEKESWWSKQIREAKRRARELKW